MWFPTLPGKEVKVTKEIQMLLVSLLIKLTRKGQ